MLEIGMAVQATNSKATCARHAERIDREREVCKFLVLFFIPDQTYCTTKWIIAETVAKKGARYIYFKCLAIKNPDRCTPAFPHLNATVIQSIEHTEWNGLSKNNQVNE